MEKIKTATHEAKAPSYTDDQVAKVMEAQKIDKMRAIHLIKRLGVEKALVPALKPATKPAKVTKAKAAKVPKAKREGGYNKDLIIKLYMEQGKTVREIANDQRQGLKGISPVYCYRVLFGTENSGGVSPEQKARRKEQAARKEAGRKADGEPKAKKESK